ncbi:hypothetical protein NDU88_006014 [Pleurodeles waltl]|uniref:Uncharacterized protein n=1 Tax=Pleurodeles waltl TaxID=8319 RepID=A0AAV7WWD0_PLEWA|nr:hypothetical protein NDU88_006014 [Pleurodeles waltl]
MKADTYRHTTVTTTLPTGSRNLEAQDALPEPKATPATKSRTEDPSSGPSDEIQETALHQGQAPEQKHSGSKFLTDQSEKAFVPRKSLQEQHILVTRSWTEKKTGEMLDKYMVMYSPVGAGWGYSIPRVLFFCHGEIPLHIVMNGTRTVGAGGNEVFI